VHIPQSDRVSQQVDSVADEWKKLDDEYLTSQTSKLRRVGRAAGSIYLAIPPGTDIWNPLEECSQRSHPKIPADKKNEYMEKLSQVLSKIPRCCDEVSNPPHLATARLKASLDSTTNVHCVTKTLSGFSSISNAKASQVFYQQTDQVAKSVLPKLVVTASLHNPHEMRPEGRKQYEVELLDSNTLADLRNILYCIHDEMASSSLQEQQPSFPAGCFFIEGRCYVDDQGVGEIRSDTRENVMNWLRSSCGTEALGETPTRRKRARDEKADPESWAQVRYAISVNQLDAGTVNILPMSSVTLGSLHFRLGVRYLFTHARYSCEHYLYFSDCRLFHSGTDKESGVMLTETFPRVNFMAKFARKKCEVCMLWSARYLAYGDRLADTNPMMFCQHCYHMLHYSASGVLIYDDFDVFPYLHDMR